MTSDTSDKAAANADRNGPQPAAEPGRVLPFPGPRNRRPEPAPEPPTPPEPPRAA